MGLLEMSFVSVVNDGMRDGIGQSVSRVISLVWKRKCCPCQDFPPLLIDNNDTGTLAAGRPWP